MNRQNILFTPEFEIDAIVLDSILNDGRVITWAHAGRSVILTVNKEDTSGFLIKLRQNGNAEVMTD